jgi:hypothetical protein
MLAKIELANKKIAWRLDIFPCSMLILFLHVVLRVHPVHSSFSPQGPVSPGVKQSFQRSENKFYSPGGVGERQTKN